MWEHLLTKNGLVLDWFSRNRIGLSDSQYGTEIHLKGVFELLQNSIGKFTWSVYLIIYCYFQDPKIYVQTILDVHKKYHALVMTAFSNDSGFVAALDKVWDLNIDTFLGFVY